MSDCIQKGGIATSRPALTPPLKWHCCGGKHYLAKKIIALMPPHTHYVEPYAGGLAVLLAKDPEGVSEVVNDLHRGLTNFWQVLQDPTLFIEFRERTVATPFSEPEWVFAKSVLEEWERGGPTEKPSALHAWAFFVHCRQSYAGRMENFAALTKSRTRRGMNEQVAAWLSAVEGLPEVHARLKRVAILNRPATDVIQQQDSPGTLFYCDPPYLHETRYREVYTHEMTDDQHHELLDILCSCQGKVLLSGYRSELYDYTLADWNRTDFDIANHAAGGGNKRRMTECIWRNF